MDFFVSLSRNRCWWKDVLVFICIWLCALTPSSGGTESHSLWHQNGTTPRFKEIFIGRCWDYQIHSSQIRIPALYYDLNCTLVFEKFKSAVAYRDKCNVTEEHYKPFFDMLERKIRLVNQSMFWSGSSEIVHSVSSVNTNYITMEDTLPGYMLDKMRWCSSKEGDGFNHTTCKGPCHKMQNRIFWKLSSELFTRSAAGTIYVMINGTRANNEPAYKVRSFFRSVEMPVMTKHVKKLIVLIARNIHKKPLESCGMGSLLELENEARGKGMEFECHDEPKIVLNVLCVKYPDSIECQDAIQESLESNTWKAIGGLFIIISIILVILIILVVMKLRAQRRSHQRKMSQRPLMNGNTHDDEQEKAGDKISNSVI